MGGDAAAISRLERLSPSTFFSRQVQDGTHARLIGEKLAAQFIRIFSSRVSHFVEKTLDRKARVRVADGAPPLHWDADFRSVQVNLKIRNPIKDVGCTFNGSAVDTFLVDHVLSEERALRDGLADDRVHPGRGIARSVEPGDKAIVPHGAIPPTGQVVFARPNNFYRRLGDLGHMHSFDDKVGGGIRASAETAAKERGMNLNFFRGQAGNLRGVGAINGSELRARPAFTATGAEVDEP